MRSVQKEEHLRFLPFQNVLKLKLSILAGKYEGLRKQQGVYIFLQ